MLDPIKDKGVDLLAERITSILDLASKKIPGYIHQGYKNGELIVNKGLPGYLAAHYAKCESIRTLIKRDSPTQLEDVYESPKFSIDNERLVAQELVTRIGYDITPTIVSGSAGSGKSVFLKHLFRDSIRSGMTFYPIFFELRTLQTGSKSSLLDEIYESIKLFEESFTRSQFNFGLKRGLFFLLVDALDEAPPERKAEIGAELVDISRKYRNCPLVVTSRPSEEFQSWEGFQVAHLLPFSKVQCISFLRKIDYSPERKRDFIDALEGGLFEQHEDFLSNPLLASMMLLTFDEFGEIPARRHVFYDKCFQVLLKEHDSSKGRYRRNFCSGLSFSEFESLFTTFCTLSYLDRKFVFTSDEIISYLQDAITACSLLVEADSVCKDLVDAASVLQKDGGHYEFTHRSFQEYFYARFVVRDRDYTLVEKIDEVASRSSDDTIDMIADMDRSYFDRDFLLPIGKKIQRTHVDRDPKIAPDLVLRSFFMFFGARVREADDYEPGEAAVADEKLSIYYSVTVSGSDSEYTKRRLNLVLYNFLWREAVFSPAPEPSARVKDAEILKAFNAKEYPKKRKDLHLKIIPQNRQRLVAVGAGFFAERVSSLIESLVNRIEKAQSDRKSRLGQKIRSTIQAK